MSQTASVVFGAIHVGEDTSMDGHGDLTVVFCIDLSDVRP